MRRNLVLVGGAALLAAAALSGGGVTAAFTSTTSAQAEISAGLFALQASTVTGGSQGDGGNGALSFHLSDGAGAQGSAYRFDVFDTGTIAGTINSISFQPVGSPPAGSTIQLQYLDSGQWTSIEGPVDASAAHDFSIDPGIPIAPMSSAPSTGAVSFRILAQPGTQEASTTVRFGMPVGVCTPQRPADQPMQGSGDPLTGTATTIDAGSTQGLGDPLTGTATTIDAGKLLPSLANDKVSSSCGPPVGPLSMDVGPPPEAGQGGHITGTLTISGIA